MEKTEIIDGIVQALSNNKKGVKVGGMWYNSFKELFLPEKGEQITIHFRTVNKDGKTYRNIVKLNASSQDSRPSTAEPPKQVASLRNDAAVKPSLLGREQQIIRQSSWKVAADATVPFFYHIYEGKKATVEEYAGILDEQFRLMREFARKVEEDVLGK